jgi:hypothetical protein
VAPFDDTNKSTIVRGESTLPGISLTEQDTFNVYNNCIQGDSRSPFVRNFLISQNRINMKIGSRLSSLLQVQIKYFQNSDTSENTGNRRRICFFKWKDPILI